MQKVLVILTAFNVGQYISRCIAPWAELKEHHEGKVFISAVSVPFAGFPPAPPDDTQGLLLHYQRIGVIDCAVIEPPTASPYTEAQARDLALAQARGRGFTPDLIFLLDGDEIYRPDLAPLEQMFEQVERESDHIHFKVPLTNIAFSTALALKEPFYVNRIWRVTVPIYDGRGTARAVCFGDDNGMDYYDTKTAKKLFEDREKPAGMIHRRNVAVDHFTWLMDETSRRKIAYHNARWGFSSYRWDIDGLHFNEEYFKQRGEPVPELEMLCKIPRGKNYDA